MTVRPATYVTAAILSCAGLAIMLTHGRTPVAPDHTMPSAHITTRQPGDTHSDELSTALGTSHSIHVEIGEQRVVAIPLRYTGRLAREVTRVTAGCGCSQARVVPKVLQPDTDATLEVTFNSQGATPGHNTYSFEIHTTDGTRYALRDALSVDLRRSIVVDPPVVTFATQEGSTFVENTTTISLMTPIALEDIIARASNPELSVRFNPRSVSHNSASDESRLAMSVDMVVQLAHATHSGPLSEHIDLTFSGLDGRSPTIRVPVRGHIKSCTTSHPERFFLGLVRPGELRELHLEVHSTCGDQLHVDAVAGSDNT
ncbi:DUF1573 domain-containing protein [Maioricimonas sp. JC845]|uniref:DUF1573 domain-containing protein n=1 Tax=Maioricimonas sp. JC845 TaxID=3232138 RepID=UPI00345B1C4D